MGDIDHKWNMEATYNYMNRTNWRLLIWQPHERRGRKADNSDVSFWIIRKLMRKILGTVGPSSTGK
jgi:hypothetical protein